MRLHYFVQCVVAAASIAGVATPALAQQRSEERGYVVGFAGATFTDVTASVFGGGVGINVHRNVQITADAGWMQDVTPTFTNDDLALLEQNLAPYTNLKTTSKVPTVFATGGVRWLLTTRTIAVPYVMGSAGFAYITPEPTFVLEGVDVTSQVMQSNVYKTSFKNETRPLVSAGGGLTLAIAPHMSLDLGYRYSRIFISNDYLQDPASPDQHSGININRVSVGLGVLF